MAESLTLQQFVETGALTDQTPDAFFDEVDMEEVLRGVVSLSVDQLNVLCRSPLAIKLLGQAAVRLYRQELYYCWGSSSLNLNNAQQAHATHDGLWVVEVLPDNSAVLRLVKTHPRFCDVVSTLCRDGHWVGLRYGYLIEGDEDNDPDYTRTNIAFGQLRQDFTLPISAERWALAMKAHDAVFEVYSS